MWKLGRVLAGLGMCVGPLLAGCSSQVEVGRWLGPAATAKVKAQQWTFGEEKARVLESEHYRLYTTIEDEEVLDLLPQVMEGAMSMYREVAAGVPVTGGPLDCFIFRWRSEWDRYTQRYAGPDAKIYLQIRSGGYTIKDRCVAYYIGRVGTFSVAAHEGWHQFAGRHFKGRLPPFLEEGIACMFETIMWSDRLPRWNLSVNTKRAEALRKAADAHELHPLQRLCSMHAGDIVDQPNDKIEGFYGQCWAFARFLWEAEGARYRPAMRKWLAEAAAGTVYDPTRSHSRAAGPWDRRAVGPMIEHYLGMDLEAVDRAYQAYAKKIAHEEFRAQW
jgi:hypothetical protein